MSPNGAASQAPDSSFGRWPIGPLRPRLFVDAVDVWCADLTAAGGDLSETLSDDERERAANIVGEPQRHAWRRSRGVLRELLGRYLSCDGAAVLLAVDDQGKPALAGPTPVAPLCFNLSHSGDIGLYAFSADAPVGVDVQVPHEDRSREVDHIALARRAFGEHEAQRLSLVEPARREWEFLRAWTRYEAELKWRGSGIGCTGEHTPPAGDARPWTIELELGATHAAAAVALSDRATELRRWSFA